MRPNRPHIRWTSGFSLIIASAILLATPATRAAAPADDNGDDTNPAMNHPDKFAWEVFSRISKPAKNGSNDAVWETWANNDETFPAKPDPAHPPEWPGSRRRVKALEEINQQQLRRQLLLRDSPHSAFLRSRGIEPQAVLPQIMAQGGREEVRRNQPDFEFIAKNGLYYREGLQTAFSKGKPIVFPLPSIEIKAVWQPIAESDKPRFHWNTDASGKLFGLAALHIMTKDLPNWFWATFEQVDNPDRCKILGCHDSFGLTPSGEVSQALKDLFKKNGLGNEWTNYRLDGTQTEFTDAVGRPTLLGNSVIEAGFVQTSSCITCHGRAAFDGTAQFLSIFTPDGQSYNGVPNPNWFLTPTQPPHTIFLQGDFIWSFIRARAASASP
jgi:hypothetical protein